MTRRAQSKRKRQAAPRGNRTAQHTTMESQPPRKGRLKAWLAGVLAAVIASTSPVWVPAMVGNIRGWFSSDSLGPALTVTAEPAFLDDQGSTMATPNGSRLSGQVRHLLTQGNVAGSPAFISAVQAMGGTDVDDLSVQLIVDGNNAQGVRIIDIRPVNLHRTEPLGGALFYVPSQAGNATIEMMFDLDEPDPIARDIGHPPCRMVTQGDTVQCVVTYDPFPQQPLAAYAANGPVDPGSLFFDNETIHLADHEQQVLSIRAQVTHFSATFDLEIDYIVGNASGDIRKLIVSDHGSPFRVTGMPSGAKPGTVSYQEAFSNQGTSLCPVADPRLIPMSGLSGPSCQT